MKELENLMATKTQKLEFKREKMEKWPLKGEYASNGQFGANKSLPFPLPCHLQGLFSRITFREPVFLGGTGNITRTKLLPVFDGFVGCIRKFIANEHEYNFKGAPYGDVSQGFDVRKYPRAVLNKRSIYWNKIGVTWDTFTMFW